MQTTGCDAKPLETLAKQKERKATTVCTPHCLCKYEPAERWKLVTLRWVLTSARVEDQQKARTNRTLAFEGSTHHFHVCMCNIVNAHDSISVLNPSVDKNKSTLQGISCLLCCTPVSAAIQHMHNSAHSVMSGKPEQICQNDKVYTSGGI